MKIRKFRFFRALTAALIILLLLTLGLKAFEPRASKNFVRYFEIENTECYVDNPKTGVFEIRPHCEQIAHFGSRVVKMTVDDLGFRPVSGTADGPRVLVLGGSVLVGYGLSDNQLQPVEALAQDSRKQFPNLTWINGSVQGYGTVQIAIRFKEMLEKFRPRLVIVDSLRGPRSLMDAATFDRTEKDSTGYPIRIKWMPEDRLPLVKWALQLGFSPDRMFEWLGLYDIVAKARQLSRIPDRTLRLNALLDPLLSTLSQMQKIATDSGVDFVVLLDGSAITGNIGIEQGQTAFSEFAYFFIPGDLTASPAELKSSLDARGIATVSLDPQFRDTLSSSAEYLVEDAYHFSEKGSKVFGEYATRALAQKLQRANGHQ